MSYPAEQPASAFQKIKPYLTGIVFVAVIGVLAIGGKILTDAKNSSRDSTGQINKQGDLSAMKIKQGDCFQTPADTTSIASVTAVPCTKAHTAQVYGVYTFVGAVLRPTDDEIGAKSDPACQDLIKTNIDDTKIPTGAKPSEYLPDDGAWTAGNHDILCIVESTTPFTGSVLKNQ